MIKTFGQIISELQSITLGEAMPLNRCVCGIFHKLKTNWEYQAYQQLIQRGEVLTKTQKTLPK